MNINGQDLSEFTSHLVVMRQMGLHEIADAIFTAHQQELDERERKAALAGFKAARMIYGPGHDVFEIIHDANFDFVHPLAHIWIESDNYKKARSDE